MAAVEHPLGAADPPAATGPEQRRLNPYVGPRAFESQDLVEGRQLYGRDWEARQLLHLLIGKRVVLLYSPSGAGKTSLIQARLIPDLVAEDFEVLPIIRVGMEPPTEVRAVPDAGPRPFNRYIVSACGCLGLELPTGVAELARLDLAAYMEQQWPVVPGGKSQVLLFDQFEEFLTVDPTDLQRKVDFLTQMSAVLRKRERWALFSMREDFLAALDPYLHLFPTPLSTTFRLDFLTAESATEAIQKPAQQAGVTFTDDAAKKLVDDLCQVLVQGPEGAAVRQTGPYVEPVQLQIVCERLWEKTVLAAPPGAPVLEIRAADVDTLGAVDQALVGYYDDRVRTIAKNDRSRERAIREWFDRYLITGQRMRGQLLQEPGRTPKGESGLDNDVITGLVDAYLVRAEKRRGLTWYELVHDRLIQPVQASNAAWFERNLTPLEKSAKVWESAGRPERMLLTAGELDEARKWATHHPEAVRTVESAFLQASYDRWKRMQWRQRAIWLGFSTAILLVVVGAIFALLFIQNQNQLLSLSISEVRQAQGTREILFTVQSNREQQVSLDQSTAAAGTAAARIQLPTALAATANRLQAQVQQVATEAVATYGPARTAAPTLVPPPGPFASPTAGYADTATPAILPVDIDREATVEALNTRLRDIRATQTALAQPLVAIAPTTGATLFSQPPSPRNITSVPGIALLMAGQRAQVITLQDELVRLQVLPSGPDGWAYTAQFLYGGNTTLLPVNRTCLAVTNLVAPPFHDGKLVSFGGANHDFLLQDPNDEQSGIVQVPVGRQLSLLHQCPGSLSYGSGVWYYVETTDNAGTAVSGWLAKEVVGPR